MKIPNKAKNTELGTNLDFRAERNSMVASKMSFAASEAYKLLRTNIMFSFADAGECHVIGLTSSFQGEGKSLSAINLAYSFAEAQKKVLLVECDMRLPTMAKRLGLHSAPGLSNLLVNQNSISLAVQSSRIPEADGSTVTLDVLVSGDIPPNPSELLGSERMIALLSVLRERYDYILLDLPPVTVVTDALIVSKLADGMIVVVRDNHASRRGLSETIRQLKLVGARILGFVYNGKTEAGGKYYSKKGYYRSNYDYKR